VTGYGLADYAGGGLIGVFDGLSLGHARIVREGRIGQKDRKDSKYTTTPSVLIISGEAECVSAFCRGCDMLEAAMGLNF
jgi:hypothetical protein